jgi:hypothetical protein
MLNGLKGEGSGVFATATREDQWAEERNRGTAQVARSTSTRPNRYAGKCAECGGWVEAEAGLLGGKVDGRWTVTHAEGQCGTQAEVVETVATNAIVFPDTFYVDDHFNMKYTVVFDDGERRTLQVRRSGQGGDDYFSGRVMIDMLTGRDNTSDYSNVAHVKDDGTVLVNRKYRDGLVEEAIRVLVGDPMAAATAYGLESERCFRCHAELTVPTSIERGLGPECAKKAFF